MNAYANRNKLAVVLLTVLTVFASAAIFVTDDSDANSATPSALSTSDFIANKSGTITIPVNIDTDSTLTIRVTEESNEIAKRDVAVTPGITSISISFSLSAGTHQLIVWVSEGSTSLGSQNVEINVKEDIWSNVGTYIALVIVAIVVIAIVVIYMRAKPNNKPTTTFTQLEEEKKASAAAPEKEKAAPKTEKIKYTSSRRK